MSETELEVHVEKKCRSLIEERREERDNLIRELFSGIIERLGKWGLGIIASILLGVAVNIWSAASWKATTDEKLKHIEGSLYTINTRLGLVDSAPLTTGDGTAQTQIQLR